MCQEMDQLGKMVPLLSRLGRVGSCLYSFGTYEAIIESVTSEKLHAILGSLMKFLSGVVTASPPICPSLTVSTT